MNPVPLAFGLSYAGWVLISLSMSRHHEQVLGHRPSTRRAAVAKGLGSAALLIAAWLCIRHWGPSVGLLGIWGGTLSASALIYVFLLPYFPRTMVRLGIAMPAVGLLLTPLT